MVEHPMVEEVARLLDPSHHLYTPDEAANYLHMTPEALKVMRWRGVGPAYIKRGSGYVRFAKADLDAWLLGLRAPGEVKASEREQPHARKAARS